MGFFRKTASTCLFNSTLSTLASVYFPSLPPIFPRFLGPHPFALKALTPRSCSGFHHLLLPSVPLHTPARGQPAPALRNTSYCPLSGGVPFCIHWQGGLPLYAAAVAWQLATFLASLFGTYPCSGIPSKVGRVHVHWGHSVSSC